MKYYFTILILFSIFFKCNSQISIELNGGLSIFNEYYQNPSFDHSFNFGGSSGFFINIPLKERISIKTGIEWNQKGFRFEAYTSLSSLNPQIPTQWYKVSIRNQLIELPILINYNIIEKEKFIFGASSGLGLGRTIGKSRHILKSLSNKDEVYKEKVSYNRQAPNGDKIKYLGLDFNIYLGVNLIGKINQHISYIGELRSQLGYMYRYKPTKEQLTVINHDKKSYNLGVIIKFGVIYNFKSE
jgi:hypothetical protein